MAEVSTKTQSNDNNNFIKNLVVMKESEQISRNDGKNTQSHFILHTSFIAFSLFTFVFDFCTDFFLVLEYWQVGFQNWAICTLVLILIPSIIVQILSFRWYLIKNSSGYAIWILHFCCCGLIYRYFRILQNTIESHRKNDECTKEKIINQQCDASILHVLESFLEAAPQLVLQIYIIVILREIRFFTALSIVASILSLSWSMTGYCVAQRRARRSIKSTLKFSAILLQSLWRFGMLSARLTALVLFLFCFQSWFFLFISIHWFVMFCWIIQQKTHLCDNIWEERLCNAVAAVIYCFCFFNLKDGRSRWRLLAFYLIIVLENMIILTIFLMWHAEEQRLLGIISFISIIGGTVIGTLSVSIYYRFFHPSGPILLSSINQPQDDNSSYISDVRSLKRFRRRIESDLPSHNASSTTESKLALSDSIVVTEEPDMEEIRTLQTWLKEAATERSQEEVRAIGSLSPATDVDEVTSSVMSTHDYENVAAVNIARACGLRHWRGYCEDIETYLHDDSIVRDTLTTRSSTTTTTDSSSAQDYLDSIVSACDDYVDCKLSYDPIVTSSVYAPPTPLHTIFEEVESMSSDSDRPPGACTLVATIDQISRATPIQEVSRAHPPRRKFSIIRQRFENSNEESAISTFETSEKDTVVCIEPPPVLPQPRSSVSPFKRVSVKEMRAFFLRQMLTPPKLAAATKKIVATLPTSQITQIVV